MKLAVLFGPLCLSFRGSFDFTALRSDPRGLTGSELGFIRIAQCLKSLGHDVHVYTTAAQTEWEGMRVRPLDATAEIDETFDAAIAINEPDLLKPTHARVRVCEAWLNDWTFCVPHFDKHVDLFVSPSTGHLDQALNNPDWRMVGVTPTAPSGTYTYEPDAAKWQVIPLGCDPERYPSTSAKVPGRVVYCSSPDRGLHWLLQEWPAVKRAVPHASLRIFYRLKPWIDTFKNLGHNDAIEGLRARALYIEEALRRMSGPDWAIEVCDSVSRERIEQEMCAAEVLAYPVDTIRWSEGFSCTILEACAARACPVITDCDALRGIYGSCVPMAIVGDLDTWRDYVIESLTNAEWRDNWNTTAHELASHLTWSAHVKKLETAIQFLTEKLQNVQHHPV